jgi:hypothetical protein
MDKFEILFKSPYARIICKKKELNTFLDQNVMNGEFKLFSCGELHYIKFKSQGLGYHQVYLEPVVSEEAKFQEYWRDNSMTPTQASNWSRDISKQKEK